MNVFAKFDGIPLMIIEVIKETKRYGILEVIKETKHYGHTVGWTDNMKTVYPPTNTVCRGYNK